MLFNWVQQFRGSNRQTKYFILTWIVYMIAIIVSTLYAYVRIDLIKSYDEQGKASIEKIEENS